MAGISPRGLILSARHGAEIQHCVYPSGLVFSTISESDGPRGFDFVQGINSSKPQNPFRESLEVIRFIATRAEMLAIHWQV